MSLVLLLNLLITAFLTGLIWFVQIVHYPIFEKVKWCFEDFHAAHTRLTGKIVILPMCLELGLSVWLCYEGYQTDYALENAEISLSLVQSFQNLYEYSVLALGLTISVWVLTAWIFVPLHGSLSEGYDKKTIQKLVVRNWFRTVVWSFRLGILAMMFLQIMKGKELI